MYHSWTAVRSQLDYGVCYVFPRMDLARSITAGYNPTLAHTEA